MRRGLTVTVYAASVLLGAGCDRQPLDQNSRDAAATNTTKAGDASPPGDVTPSLACSLRAAGDCDDDLCVFGCCPGQGGAGCAGCCQPRACSAIPADKCPLGDCQIMIDCAGQPACTSRFSAPPPACGPVSYYGQDVPCCAGLTKRCGAARADGSCDPTAGGYNDFPWCLACGDGACDPPFENRCNCPEDCN